MTIRCSDKNILIVGCNNDFGEQIVHSLAVEGNALLLCGNSEGQQRKLIEAYPRHIKAVSSLNRRQNLKNLQAMIEIQGSLDAVIYMVSAQSATPFFEQPWEQIDEIFESNLIEPIYLFKAIFPYLRKAGDCKVMFVQTSAVSQDSNQSATHLASQYGLWGFCMAVQRELQLKGIDVKNISTPAIVHGQSPATTSPQSLSYQQCKKLATKISEVIKTTGEVTLPDPVTDPRLAIML